MSKLSANTGSRNPSMRNQLKLEIGLFFMNFNSVGFLKVLYGVLDAGYGLSRYLGDCRPNQPKLGLFATIVGKSKIHTVS